MQNISLAFGLVAISNKNLELSMWHLVRTQIINTLRIKYADNSKHGDGNKTECPSHNVTQTESVLK
jgi:hypothetical protein